MISKLLNKPLAVYYTGASAGCFFTLSLALVTQETHTISSTLSVQEIIKQNWAIESNKNWDSFQVDYDYNFHPGTTILNSSPIDGKLPIIKYDQAEEVYPNQTSILIYTDVETQLALMEMKGRGYFKQAYINQFNNNNLEHYAKVRDDAWTICNTVNDLYKLPYCIKQELVVDFSFPDFDLSYNDQIKQLSNLTFEYNGMRVLNRYNNLVFDKVEYKFLLQDVIKTKFKCVTDTFNLTHTQEVQDHVDLWVNLHPNKIQKMFYKDI